MSENNNKQIKIKWINNKKQNKEKGLKTSLICRKPNRWPPNVNFAINFKGGNNQTFLQRKEINQLSTQENIEKCKQQKKKMKINDNEKN